MSFFWFCCLWFLVQTLTLSRCKFSPVSVRPQVRCQTRITSRAWRTSASTCCSWEQRSTPKRTSTASSSASTQEAPTPSRAASTPTTTLTSPMSTCKELWTGTGTPHLGAAGAGVSMNSHQTADNFVLFCQMETGAFCFTPSSAQVHLNPLQVLSALLQLPDSLVSFVTVSMVSAPPTSVGQLFVCLDSQEV